MRKMVSFVEGQGDHEAVPKLLSKLLQHFSPDGEIWAHVSISSPWRVGNIGYLARNDFREWTSKLRLATKDPAVKAILLLLDGDAKSVLRRPFCATEMAMTFALKAREVGAGSIFSVAVVFAISEYESWFIAGTPSLAGRQLSDGRSGLLATTQRPPANIEDIRDAKGWLSRNMQRTYKETLDQLRFTELVDLDEVRSQGLRSFSRVEHAVQQLTTAIKSGKPICTPC